jgi:hypothetical protein
MRAVAVITSIAKALLCDEHAVGDAGDHVHCVVPDGDFFEVFGVEAPGSVEGRHDFIVDVGDDVVDSARQTLVDYSFVEYCLE